MPAAVGRSGKVKKRISAMLRSSSAPTFHPLTGRGRRMREAEARHQHSWFRTEVCEPRPTSQVRPWPVHSVVGTETRHELIYRLWPD